MVRLKTDEEIVLLREGGRHIAQILDELESMVAPGVTSGDLDTHAEKLVRQMGDIPSLKGYRPDFSMRPYPSTLCVSVNDVVEHGMPFEPEITLQEGDIVGIDLTITHKGMVVDSGRTVPVGSIDTDAQQLLEVTKEALMRGIAVAHSDNTVGDIGYAIESYVKPFKYGVVDVLCGHGVGYAVHEDPQVPNFGRPGKGAMLKPGMVLAIEPMVNLGRRDVIFERDGYTVRTKDGSRSAHFEHTVVILPDGPEILTLA